MPTSPLEKALKGEKLTDRGAQGALSLAVKKITNLSKRADGTKEAVTQTASAVVHTAETQGSLFLASMAEGYFGQNKLKVGGVDVRAPLGLLAQGYGLYEMMSGNGGGGHSLALGNGFMGSWLASVGVNAGQRLAETKDNKNGEQQAQNGAHAPALTDTPVIQGPLREIVLTPEPEPMTAGRSSHESSRFVRASVR